MLTAPFSTGPGPTEVQRPVDHVGAKPQVPAKQRTPSNPQVPAELKKGSKHNTVFELGSRYRVTKMIGQGAFGCVVAGERADGMKVAIKKLANAGADKTAAKRLLRELRFLRHLRGHPNIVNMEDVVLRRADSKLDVYIMTELMEADLEQIIKSSQTLSGEHVRCLIFQLLNGLRHMHAAGIVHRDLKPANLVVDSQCRLKICDFGLSRHISDPDCVPEGQDAQFTDYVVTRWYRAPELLMGSKKYTAQVDTWAAGCILAELMGRKPVFAGDNTSDMLVRIARKIGKPTRAEMLLMTEQEAARNFVTSIPEKAVQRWDELYPNADMASLQLLQRLLVWSPLERASVEEALKMPLIKDLCEAPRQLSTDHVELAQISQGNLPPWKVFDLLCNEGSFWRQRQGHCRVATMPGHNCFSCSCGAEYNNGISLLHHLDPESAVHDIKIGGRPPSAPSMLQVV